jgi:hypothetical protein
VKPTLGYLIGSDRPATPPRTGARGTWLRPDFAALQTTCVVATVCAESKAEAGQANHYNVMRFQRTCPVVRMCFIIVVVIE